MADFPLAPKALAFRLDYSRAAVVRCTVMFSPMPTTRSCLDSAPRIRHTVSEIQADFRLIPASRGWFCPTRQV
jgi:hypothetical protein